MSTAPETTSPVPATVEESALSTALRKLCRLMHEQAMAECERALEARRGGDTPQAITFFQVALGLETVAAMHAGLIPNYRTQAILLHSAAELAGNIDLLERGVWHEPPGEETTDGAGE